MRTMLKCGFRTIVLLRIHLVVWIGVGGLVIPGLGKVHARTEIVALRGEVAPGTGEGVFFDGVSAPALNEVGQVAYHASLMGPGVDVYNNSGLWRDQTLIVQMGDPAPGGPEGTVFDVLNIGSLNRSGQVAHLSNVFNPSTFDYYDSNWRDTTLITPIESSPPGTEVEVRYDPYSFYLPFLNDAGQVAYQAKLTGPGVDESNNSGVWRDTTLVARTGNPAPGLPEGVHFDRHVGPIDLNQSGQVAYLGDLDDPDHIQGIWRDTTLVALAGTHAPGTPVGVEFRTFMNGPDLNDSGQVAYRSWLTGVGVDSSNDHGIWRDSTLLAREGDPAPGMPDGVVFGSWLHDFNLALNNAGQVAHRSFVVGASPGVTGGIWRDTTLIVHMGDQAPGLPEGTVISHVSYPVLNDLGVVLFRSHLSVEGALDGVAVWLADGIEKVLVFRDEDEVDGTVFRGPGFNNSDRSLSSATSLNDFGQVAFAATKGGPSGILLYTPDLHWRGTAGDDQWDSRLNWTLSTPPAHVHDVFVDPDVALTVAGPGVGGASVRTLMVGGGSGDATLQLNGGDLEAMEGFTLEANGVLDVQPGTVFTSGGPATLTGTINVNGQAVFNGPVDGPADIGGSGVVRINDAYDPGASAAVVNISPGVVLGPDAVVTIEVQAPVGGGVPVAGVDFDQLNHTGAVTLDGTLNIVLLDPGTRPVLGTEYPVATSVVPITTIYNTITGSLIDTDLALVPLLAPNQLTLRASIPGDTDGDNAVSVSDLSAFALNFGTTPGLGAFHLGDFNADGAVTVADLSLLALNFGFDLDAGIESSGLSLDVVAAMAGIDRFAIPEPGIFGVVGVGGLALVRKRQTRGD